MQIFSYCYDWEIGTQRRRKLGLGWHDMGLQHFVDSSEVARWMQLLSTSSRDYFTPDLPKYRWRQQINIMFPLSYTILGRKLSLWPVWCSPVPTNWRKVDISQSLEQYFQISLAHGLFSHSKNICATPNEIRIYGDKRRPQIRRVSNP